MSDLYERPGPDPLDAARVLAEAIRSGGPLGAEALDALLTERRALLAALALVKECRRAQRQYYRARDNLGECKGLEKRLDAALERI